MPAKATGTQKSLAGRTVAVWVLAVAAVVVLGGLAVWGFLSRPLSSAPARSELTALRARLGEVRAAIAPIAVSFTSVEESAAVDVSDYRTRIGAARELVDSTNGMPASSPDAEEVRDLIVTGGSQVLDGFDGALNALESNDASAAAAPASLVDEGIATLQQAQDTIDRLLGGS